MAVVGLSALSPKLRNKLYRLFMPMVSREEADREGAISDENFNRLLPTELGLARWYIPSEQNHVYLSTCSPTENSTCYPTEIPFPKYFFYSTNA